MLVLTRKRGDVVLIGDEIRIEVLSMTRGRVSLGITAPDTVEVKRMEISVVVDRSYRAVESSSPSNID